MLKFLAIGVPICFGLWAIYKLNRLVVADTNKVPMNAERRRLLIRAAREQDEALGIGS